jgi:hypothetical protein
MLLHPDRSKLSNLQPTMDYIQKHTLATLSHLAAVLRMSPVLTPGSIASGPVKNVTWFQVTALMTSKVQHMELTDKMIVVSDTQLF